MDIELEDIFCNTCKKYTDVSITITEFYEQFLVNCRNCNQKITAIKVIV